MALTDWCWGGDPQWLYQASDDNRIWSHDHGHYLPGGPDWRIELLETSVGQPPILDLGSFGNLDEAEVNRLSIALRELKTEDITGILEWIPGEWPVTDDELRHLGWFLDTRRHDVADRLEAAMKGVSA